MPRPARAKPKDKVVRLDAQAWIAAGFDALADAGIDAVRVEPLAKSLAITKGSFYWHFADMAAYRQALIESWAQDSMSAWR
jgi:AcrR family transcriptional regulator